MAFSSLLVEVSRFENVLCRMKAADALASAVPRSIGPRRIRRAVSGIARGPGFTPAPRRGASCRGARRSRRSRPRRCRQRRLGRGPRAARLVIDAVVVVGEALDDEPLEGGGVQPARASATSSLSLAATILWRLLVPSRGLLACISARELVLSVARIRRWCAARGRGGGSVRCGCVAVPPTGRAEGGHRGRRRADAHLARGSPGLGTSRARRIRGTAYARR